MLMFVEVGMLNVLVENLLLGVLIFLDIKVMIELVLEVEIVFGLIKFLKFSE